MFEVFITSSKLQHQLPVALFEKSFTALSIGPCGVARCVCWRVVVLENESGGQPAITLKEG